MNRKKHMIGAFIILIIILPVILNPITAKAASATVSFSTESTIVSKGNSLTVSLIIDADETIGDFEGFISYDSDILEYENGGNTITGGEGILRISDTDVSDGSVKRKYSMKFKALKVGNCEFTMLDKPMVYSYDTGEDMSVSSNGITVKVMTAEKSSKDTSLAELRISPGTLSPPFEPDTYNYYVEVENTINEIIVSAKANHEKASVQISGNTNLIEGENKVILTVRAESGDTKDYIINVKKEEIIKKPEENQSDSMYIEGTYRYEQTALEDTDLIPEGFVKTKIVIEGKEITAYTKEDTVENEFLLIYAINDKGEKNFYQYDRIEKTMQRYTSKEESQIQRKEENDTSISSDAKEYNAKLTQLSLIIAALCAFTVLLLILLIRQFLKYRGYKDDLD